MNAQVPVVDTWGLPVIGPFDGEYEFLSNFYWLQTPMQFWGFQWNTSEHPYQAFKSLHDKDWAELAVGGLSKYYYPGQAKRRGKQIKCRPDWERVKIQIMLMVVWHKFKDPELSAKLLATGDSFLVEINTWGDVTWGAVQQLGPGGGKLYGTNFLGLILMLVRKHIREGTVPDWDSLDVSNVDSLTRLIGLSNG